MTRLTQQSVALVQSAFTKHLVGAADGIAGTRTKNAITGWQGQSQLPTERPGYLTRRQFIALTGCPLADDGNPDYAAFFKSMGIACRGYDTPGVAGRFVPVGIIIHHTGALSGRQQIPPERMITGRSGLPGPIVQVGVSRDLSVGVYTNGRAHHAGKGASNVLAAVKADKPAPEHGDDDTSGNTHFLGIEVDHAGIASEQFGPQWAKAAQVAAAWCKLWGWDPRTRVIGHSDWTSRKTDPIYPMSAFEDIMLVATRSTKQGTAGMPTEPPPEGDYAVIGGKRYKLVPDA